MNLPAQRLEVAVLLRLRLPCREPHRPRGLSVHILNRRLSGGSTQSGLCCSLGTHFGAKHCGRLVDLCLQAFEVPLLLRGCVGRRQPGVARGGNSNARPRLGCRFGTIRRRLRLRCRLRAEDSGRLVNCEGIDGLVQLLSRLVRRQWGVAHRRLHIVMWALVYRIRVDGTAQLLAGRLSRQAAPDDGRGCTLCGALGHGVIHVDSGFVLRCQCPCPCLSPQNPRRLVYLCIERLEVVLLILFRLSARESMHRLRKMSFRFRRHCRLVHVPPRLLFSFRFGPQHFRCFVDSLLQAIEELILLRFVILFREPTRFFGRLILR